MTKNLPYNSEGGDSNMDLKAALTLAGYHYDTYPSIELKSNAGSTLNYTGRMTYLSLTSDDIVVEAWEVWVNGEQVT